MGRVYILTLCLLDAVTGSFVCSRNVAASYDRNFSLVTQVLPYSTVAKTEDACKESCVSADICRYMWFSPDGVCRLYDINATASIISNAGHVTLTKLCGECYEVFNRYNGTKVNVDPMPEARTGQTELSCIELCINSSSSCAGTMLSGDSCYIIPPAADLNHTIPADHYDTYIPLCTPMGRTSNLNTEPSTSASVPDTYTEQSSISTGAPGDGSTLPSITTTQVDTTAAYPGSATTDSGSATTDSSSATTDSGSATTDSSSATTDKGSATTDSSSATTDKGSATTESGSSTTDKGSATTDSGSATTDKGSAPPLASGQDTSTTEAASAVFSKREDTTLDMVTFSTQDTGQKTNNGPRTTTGRDEGDQYRTTSKSNLITENTPVYPEYDGTFNEYVRCPEPYLPVNTKVTSTNRRYNAWSVATVSCTSSRYVFPEGGTHRTLICLPTGHWHINLTKDCLPINTCDAIDGGDKASGARYPVDTIRNRECDADDKLPSGLSSRRTVCLSNGDWFGTYGTCKAERCGPLPWFENATVHITSYDNVADYYSRHNATCRRGYRFLDGTRQKVIECKPGGYWTNIDDCLIEVCPALIQPQNAVLNTTLSVYGTMVTMSCLPGYKLQHNETHLETLCLGREGWTVNITDCTAITCSPPVDVLDCTRDNNQSFYLSNVTYQCNDNLTFEDGYRVKTITCMDSGQWSETNFTCAADRCPPTPALEAALPDTTRAVEGTVVTYTCNPGYKLVDDDKLQTITCQGGEWQHVSYLSECHKINCSALNTTVGHYAIQANNDSGVAVGSRVLVTCHRGYVFPGGGISMDFECLLTGSWSVNYTCQPVVCGVPPTVHHARMVMEQDTKYNDKVSYYCLEGYWFSRKIYSYSAVCQADGRWSHIPSSCTEIRCPPLTLENALMTSSQDTLLHSDVNVTCNGTDYVITVTCLSNGDWYPTPPTCNSDERKQFVLEPEEAPHSLTVGTAMLLTLVAVSVVVIMSDIALLYGQCRGKLTQPERKQGHRVSKTR